MTIPNLIFCAGGNPTFAKIAIDCGYFYGARLPSTVYGRLYFSDQDWKRPNRIAYMREVEKYKPFMASVIDWCQEDQLNDVLSWAEEVANHVEVIMIVPKIPGSIPYIPRSISGKPVRLGYSVPTKHGGTMLNVAEFSNRPVHLLGGSPAAQMKLSRYLNVKSADGNMHMKMANMGLFWEMGKSIYSNKWTSLLRSDGKTWDGNGNEEAFRRSCLNIKRAWIKFSGAFQTNVPLFTEAA